ncbi:GMC family oxidoreductase [Paraglaciecola aestuariivivens]
MSESPLTAFDFIIVGAGSAGAVMAARLSENPQIKVCLIEAGSKDKNPLIHIPFGLSVLARIKHLNWHYYTSEQSQLNNRKLYWPRGKVLGGSSSINAMCYIRGVPADYNNWHQSGAQGWQWSKVLPYFKKSEKFQAGASELHSDQGLLQVSELRHHNPLSNDFVKAAEVLGLNQVQDFNSLEREGLGFYQVTQTSGQRCSSAKAYLKPAMLRNNLTVITEALVEKILVSEGRATGVQVKLAGKSTQLSAGKEVILSAGAINSPQLLMLSGIGPAEHLQLKQIKVKRDLPGVGQNLQDHLDVIVQHKCKKPASYAVSLRKLPAYIQAAFKYAFNRQGLFTSNIAEAGGFDKSQYSTELADLQYHFLPALLEDHGRTTVFGFGFGLHVCALYPKSRGHIQLNSNRPDDPPVIDPNYLSHKEDIKVLLAGLKRARKLLAAASLSHYQSWEVSPGKSLQSDEQLINFIKAQAQSIYHPVGTCKMGKADEATSVVDAELKVLGIKGLRVADASVMPTIVGGNTNAPTIMIAERCADFIKHDHKL